MFSKLWNAVVEFFRSATFRGMQLGAEDFAKQFEAEARELSAAPPAATPPAISVAVVAAVTQVPAPQPQQKSLPAAQPTAPPKPITAVQPQQRPALEARLKEPTPTPDPPQSNDGYPVPVKRGRGRPKKNPDTPPEQKGGGKC